MTSGGLRGRRRPRPTIRFLRLLPFDSFPDADQARCIAQGRWQDIDISRIRHPLIEDAALRFAQGDPTTHRSSSALAGRPVYEVRSRTGAGWRGAVVLDDAGDPWLIWADRHDQFNDHAADALKIASMQYWLPKPVEYKLRQRDDAAEAHRAWRVAAVATFVEVVAEALESVEQRSTVQLPCTGGEELRVEVELDHDLPGGHPEDDTSLLTVMIRVGSQQADDFLRFVLPAIQPDASRIDAVYGRDSTLETWVTVSQAELTLFIAAVRLAAAPNGAEAACAPNTHLHYVDKYTLADLMIEGHAARGICGFWFVPTRDEHAVLPVCPKCEALEPAAERTVHLIRQALAVEIL